MLKIFLTSILFLSCVSCEQFRFDNYTLYKLLPNNIEQIKLLQDLQNSDFRYDFWNDPGTSVQFVNILSSPKDRDDLESFMKSNEIRFEISMANIQEAIDKESVKKYTRRDIRSMQWDAYYEQDAIDAWIDDLAAEYSDVATVVIAGRSIEGREIKGLKISHGPDRRVIFIEGGIHAREWISPATVNFMINELLTSDDEDIKAAARDYDWYLFPVTNPDGYIWSHEQFRMWRKNRRNVDGVNFGVDLNRNWNSNWLVVGASSNPATEIYAGLGPFSEPEARMLSRLILSIGDKIDIYLTMHSFGQMLLLPFGNTSEPLANYHEAMNVGRRAMGALSVRYGTEYVTGNIVEILSAATGGSDEWVKEALDVPFVYCYELRDRGTFGFLLPGDQIRPNSEEVMDSVIDLIHQARRFGHLNSGSSITGSLMMISLAMMLKFW